MEMSWGVEWKPGHVSSCKRILWDFTVTNYMCQCRLGLTRPRDLWYLSDSLCYPFHSCSREKNQNFIPGGLNCMKKQSERTCWNWWETAKQPLLIISFSGTGRSKLWGYFCLYRGKFVVFQGRLWKGISFNGLEGLSTGQFFWWVSGKIDDLKNELSLNRLAFFQHLLVVQPGNIMRKKNVVIGIIEIISNGG